MAKQLLGSLELNRIYQMDCAGGMRLLPDDSIDLTVTSPPYDNLRTYNGYSFDFEKIAQELYRVTKPGGVVVWIVCDATINGSETGTSFRQALYFKEIGFNLHDTMIWYKPNPMPTQRLRYEQSFEYMFILSKGRPSTTNLLTEPTKKRWKRQKHTFTGDLRNNGGGYYETKSEKIRHNIFQYVVGGGKNAHIRHPAMFPEELARDHILSWSNPNEIVLDPFMGSGTTAKMALLNNRNFIGFEISREYIEIANKRLESVLAEKEGGHDA